ncbi:MAG: glycosyltransferase family 4 protein [Anaerolineales bacterium]|nr:glycosyltransferase family 4 protein [Anaerolineales bacterium]
MRVGLLIYGSLATLSGGYLYDRKLVEHLRAAGDEVEIISVPWRNYAAHLTDNFLGELRQRLLSGQWEVLLQDELNHPSLFLLNGWLKPHVRYPIVSIVHHLRCSELRPRWQNTLYGWVERAYLRSMDGFVFNSETTSAVVWKKAGMEGKPKPHVVAYPAADHALTPGLKATPAPGVRESTLKILFLGNVIPRKGLHALIDALAHVRGAWQLTVAGRLDVDAKYVKDLRGLKDPEGLVWLGQLSDDEVRVQLATHDVLAVPSSYEGFGIVYLEALAYGLPVIATTAGAAHEIITPGREGFLVPPENPAVLAQVLQTLIDDVTLLPTMRHAARHRFIAWPTWAESMGRVRAFLQNLVS